MKDLLEYLAPGLILFTVILVVVFYASLVYGAYLIWTSLGSFIN